MRKILLLISFLTYSAGSLLWGGTTGKLTGKVVDAETKEPMPFVNIILMGTNFGAASDLDGNYVILNLPPGKYTVRAQAIGYQPVEFQNVSISIDLTTTQDFELKETAVELEAIVVESKQDIVQKDVTSSQSLISSDEIKALPVSEFNDVLQLQAGVTKDADGGFHIRGGRTTEIAYWVNGVSITDAYDNSRGIEIDNNSIQELQVISGTFNAEYGNAMSGIINTVTKEGGKDYHGSVLLYAGDHVSNFTEYFPHIDNIYAFSNYNVQGSLSGPIPYTNNLISFFVNARYFYDDGYLYGTRQFNPDGTPGDSTVQPMNWHRTYYGQGNIGLSPIQNLKINLEGLYSKDDFQDYNHEYRLNPDGDVNKFATSYNATGTVTHMLTSSTFYEVKGSYFFKDFNEYLYSNPYDSRYLHPDSLQHGRADNYSFRTMGTNLHRFFRETNTFLGKVDFTSQLNNEHLVKLGAEVRNHSLQFDDYTLEPHRTNNIEDSIFTPSIPDINQTNRRQYENRPFEASAYVQDKIEFEHVIINFGIRYDYFDANGKVLVDVKDPNIYAPLRLGMDELTIAEREPYFYKDSQPKWKLSPRFGIAYPISATGVVHFSYGHFLQIPPFQYLFQNGPYKIPNSGAAVGVFGNPDLKPQTTVMYEIGFRQEFFDDYLIDVTGFYRDVRDWITAGTIIQTYNLVTYSIFTNKDYANVKGITLTFNKRFSNYFSFDFNYTYQVAEGTNSKEEDAYNAQISGGEPSLFLIPMNWDQNHLLNASIYTGYEGWGASLIARYGTGLPYSPTVTQYTADRGISTGLLPNSRRIPSQFSMDLKLEKSFQLTGINVNAFLRVFNLLDNRIPLKVYEDTGQPDYTTQTQTLTKNPASPTTPEEYFKYPDHYGEPRNVQFGIDLTF